MKQLIYLLISFSIFSCDSSDAGSASELCIDRLIEMFEMEPYEGEIGFECRSHLIWFTFQEEDYFMLENPCFDIIQHLWNCDKVNVCDEPNLVCQTILASIERQGVVARG